VLVDRWCQTLAAAGVEIRLSTRVEGLLSDQGRLTGVGTDDGAIAADCVVATIPTTMLAALVRPIEPAYATELAQIRYLGAICTVLSLEEKLSDTYWTNVTDPGFDFGGVIEQTNLMAPAAYGGRHLVYLSRYLSVDDPLWKLDDEALLARQIAQLEAMVGRPVGQQLKRHWVFRSPLAATLTEMGFQRRIPAMRSPIPGLFVASMCHIYPDERSVNNSIRVAAEVVRAMGFAAVADSVPRGLSLAGRYVAKGKQLDQRSGTPGTK
jgi:protoporphyrinogen oxidase